MKQKTTIVGVIVVLLMSGAVGLFRSSPFERTDADPKHNRAMETRAALLQIGAALEMWVQQHGMAPAEGEQWSALQLTAVPADGWGHALVYRINPVDKKKFRLYSIGPDGVDNGGHQGDDVDF